MSYSLLFLTLYAHYFQPRMFVIDQMYTKIMAIFWNGENRPLLGNHE